MFQPQLLERGRLRAFNPISMPRLCQTPPRPANNDGCTIPNSTTGQPTACDAIFSYGYSYPSRLNSTSIRLDHNLDSHIHAFIRYSDTPSAQVTGAEQVLTQSINVHTWTAGLTANLTSSLLDDFRFNYSYDGEQRVNSQRSIGGSVPIPRNLVIPSAYDTPVSEASTTVKVPGTSLSVGTQYGGTVSFQHQYQLVDSLSWTRRSHVFKFGGDWRRLSPTVESGYDSATTIQGLTDIQHGNATSVSIILAAPGAPVFDNLSLYMQDHWKARPTLSFDYGLRWEFNPPPGPSNGHYPAVLTTSNLTTATLAPAGTPPYSTSYDRFAPRVGFAWNAIVSEKHPLTVRGGFGIFYDTGQNLIGNAYNGTYPFVAQNPTLSEVPLPLSASALTPPSQNVIVAAPYPYLNGAISSPDLTLPYTEQWNLSLDETLNSKNTVTASYVGNNGRKLLFSQAYSHLIGNPNFPNSVTVTSNAAHSSYNALQIQDIGRITNGLNLVASFTFAHALDNASADDSFNAPTYGNSNNDIRRSLNLALNYQTPTGHSSGVLEALAHGWLLANRFSTQSGYPIDITQTSYIVLPNGDEAEYYPDLVQGMPIYLHGRDADVNGKPVPGSWRLNRAAFACTTTGATSGPCTETPTRQGTLGRNFIRNPVILDIEHCLAAGLLDLRTTTSELPGGSLQYIQSPKSWLS